jgi:hypothetical protein
MKCITCDQSRLFYQMPPGGASGSHQRLPAEKRRERWPADLMRFCPTIYEPSTGYLSTTEEFESILIGLLDKHLSEG